MFNRIIQSVAVLSMCFALTLPSNNKQPEITEPVVKERVTVQQKEYTSGPIRHIETKTMTKSMSIGFSNEEIDLLALVTMAEAEGESERGKRLVISTILNRLDSEYFPDTIHDIVYQSGAFSSMWNGRVDRCYVREDIRQLVVDEMVNRTDDDVIFFRAGKYSEYGVPMFVEGDHYFSSYN